MIFKTTHAAYMMRNATLAAAIIALGAAAAPVAGASTCSSNVSVGCDARASDAPDLGEPGGYDNPNPPDSGDGSAPEGDPGVSEGN